MTEQKRDRGPDGPSREEIVKGLRQAGLKTGGLVLVHSAMRTFNWIEGGAETVVDALLEVLGQRGTLIVPTFTFAHEAEKDPIIDPVNDRSEMGVITETVRLRPDALRSIAFRHSFAGVGRWARVITEIDPALSPFDLHSSFGAMLALNTQILLLGVTYASSTSHHAAEFYCDVPYRHTIDLQVKLKSKDGSIVTQPMIDYQPKPGTDGSYYGSQCPDFNRLGRMLEDRGLVGLAAIGNCAVRRFALRDLVDLSLIEMEKDPDIFRTPEGQIDYYTPLDFGEIVFSPDILDGAGHLSKRQWCVMDESKLVMPA